MPKYHVRYGYGMMGAGWRYDICDELNRVVRSGVLDATQPESAYAADVVAHELCDKMNEQAAPRPQEATHAGNI
jgi:hypothetical protein